MNAIPHMLQVIYENMKDKECHTLLEIDRHSFAIPCFETIQVGR